VGDAVHLWQAAFADWKTRLVELGSVLDAEETARASRFLRQEDGERYLFAHGLLRQILGACVGRDPGVLAFAAGPQEKPHLTLPEGGADPDWQFNLSHSGDRILIGVARGRPVGVDVERIARTVEVESLSRRFFSAEEADAILRLPQSARKAAFIDTWVGKEAFIKAVGEGLSMALDSFSIVAEGGGVRIVGAAGRRNPHLEQPWSIRRFSIADGYAGAVVVRGASLRVSGFLRVPA
jgi:4'-phosphopantetheinyl transferase